MSHYPHIALDDFDAGIDIGGASVRVHARLEIVQNPHFIASFEQAHRQYATR
jgi:hypothetical protein